MTRTERYEAFAAQFREDDYPCVTFVECATCGLLEWHSGRKGEPGYSVEPMRDRCYKCAEVYQRNPEIAVWVLNVIETKLRMSAHEAE